MEAGGAGATRAHSANPYLVTFICAFVALLDGFDLQAAAYAAPAIQSHWHIVPAFLGLILSASLFGVFVGALALSPLADRFGRKRLILVSALLFGGFSLGAAVAPSPAAFLIFRILTGIGLGGAMPSLIGMVAETAPADTRARFVAAMWVGLPAGSVIGGLVAGPLMDALGWRGIFWAGGLVPVLLLPLLWAVLPNDERRGAAGDAPRSGGALREVRALFGTGYTRITLLLWTAFFMNLLVLHVLSAWLPTLLKTGGLSAREALIAASAYHFGGILGGLALGAVMDRARPIGIMVLTYGLGCLMVLGAACTAGSFYAFLPFAIAVGASTIGAQVVLNAVAALAYPDANRATGVGWALGMGRWGSILGPASVGVLVGAGRTTRGVVLAVIVPMAVAALAMALQPERAARAVRSAAPSPERADGV